MFGNTSSVSTPPPNLGGVKPSLYASNQSAIVLPWFAGSHWLGVTWIGDVFNVRTTQNKIKTGKSSTTSGYNYYACFAGVIANGVVDRITAIKFNENVVWSGIIVRGSADFEVVTIPNIGHIRVYWGTETQGMDSLLAASGQEHSPMRGQFYIVGDDIFLGADVTTVPNITIAANRCPTPSWLTTGYVDGVDANPMVVLWEWWTDHRFGMGISEDQLDIPRLTATALTLKSEGIGVSPLLTSDTDFKSALLKLLEYFDGYPTSYGGKLGIELVRSYHGRIPGVSKESLISDASIQFETWMDTFDVTLVKFTDFFLQEGADDNARHPEPANFQITQRHNTQNKDREWFSRYEVAIKVAGAIGRSSGVPKCSGSFQIRESAATNLLVGSLFSMLTRDGEELRLRVSSRSEPAPDRRSVGIEFIEDASWANDLTHAAPSDAIADRPTFGVAQAFAIQLVNAPFAFSETGGLIYLVARGETIATSYDVWRASESGGAFTAASAHRENQTFANFSVKAQLTAAYDAGTETIDQVTGIAFDVVSPDASILDGEWDLSDGLNYTLLAFINTDAREIMSLFNVAKVGPVSYTANVVRGLYDTVQKSHAIGTDVWLQLRTNVDVDPWAPFTQTTRYFKVQPAFASSSVPLGDIAEIPFAENGRAFMPIAPGDIAVNGDRTHAVWVQGNDIVVTWANTARERTKFGTPLGESETTDLTSVTVEIWDYDGTVRKANLTGNPPTGTMTISNGRLVLIGNTDFLVRVYGVRNTWVSMNYSEIKVRRS